MLIGSGSLLSGAAAASAGFVLIVAAAGRCGRAPQRREDYLMSAGDAARCGSAPLAASSGALTSRQAANLLRPCFQISHLEVGAMASYAFVIDQRFLPRKCCLTLSSLPDEVFLHVPQTQRAETDLKQRKTSTAELTSDWLQSIKGDESSLG